MKGYFKQLQSIKKDVEYLHATYPDDASVDLDPVYQQIEEMQNIIDNYSKTVKKLKARVVNDEKKNDECCKQVKDKQQETEREMKRIGYDVKALNSKCRRVMASLRGRLACSVSDKTTKTLIRSLIPPIQVEGTFKPTLTVKGSYVRFTKNKSPKSRFTLRPINVPTNVISPQNKGDVICTLVGDLTVFYIDVIMDSDSKGASVGYEKKYGAIFHKEDDKEAGYYEVSAGGGAKKFVLPGLTTMFKHFGFEAYSNASTASFDSVKGVTKVIGTYWRIKIARCNVDLYRFCSDGTMSFIQSVIIDYPYSKVCGWQGYSSYWDISLIIKLVKTDIDMQLDWLFSGVYELSGASYDPNPGVKFVVDWAIEGQPRGPLSWLFLAWNLYKKWASKHKIYSYSQGMAESGMGVYWTAGPSDNNYGDFGWTTETSEDGKVFKPAEPEVGFKPIETHPFLKPGDGEDVESKPKTADGEPLTTVRYKVTDGRQTIGPFMHLDEANRAADTLTEQLEEQGVPNIRVRIIPY